VTPSLICIKRGIGKMDGEVKEIDEVYNDLESLAEKIIRGKLK